MKLQESLKGLICEIASIDSVRKAIESRQVVSMYYDGDEPGGRGIREVEPVALGKSKAGNYVVRGWDREGSSHTAYKGEQPLPSWRLFRLDKILSFKPTGEIYNEPKPGYNFKGDKSMVSVDLVAKFDNQQPQETEQPQPTQETPTPTPTPQT
jgi:predicted DNA-binding transcriptional regulator YafY